MPKGVEHEERVDIKEIISRCVESLMPKGVEHTRKRNTKVQCQAVLNL